MSVVAELAGALLDGVLLKGSVLVMSGWFLCILLGRASAAVRHGVWMGVFMGLVVVAGGAVAPTAVNLAEGMIAAVGEPHPERGPAAEMLPSASPAFAAPVLAMSSRAEPAGTVALGGLLTAAVALWLVVGLGEMVRLALRYRSAARLFDSARPASPTVQAAISRVAAMVGLNRCPTVRLSAEVWSPGVVGLFRHHIVLPLAARSWDDDAVRSSLLHEATHLKRGDPGLCLAARVIRAWFWMNPLVWLAERALAAERERACDDAAIRSGQDPVRYAEHLVRVALAARAFRSGHRAAAPALSLAGSAPLLDRVNRIVSPLVDRSPLGVRGTLITITAAFLAASAVATVRLIDVKPTSTVDAHIQALFSRDADERRQAAWALGEREDPRAVLSLSAALTDRDPRVRAVSAWALGEIKDPLAIQPLTRALADASPRVREMAILALGEIENPTALEAVRAAGRRDADLAQAARWAEAEIEGRGVSEVWAGSHDVGDSHALSGPRLGVSGGPMAALANSDPEARAAAALALGRAGHADAVGTLLDLLDDREPEVRAAAVWALDEISQR